MHPPDSPTPSNTNDLVPLVYDELRRIAQEYFRNLRPGFTLCPTELVNEACLHLLQHSRNPWTGPEHFRAIATRKIWQVIVDHLRQRTAAKRGGVPAEIAGSSADESGGATPWHRIPLENIQVEWQQGPVDLLDLADALEELGRESARLHEVVMLHWFAGLKYTDVGELLGISASTAEKDFRFALAWLSRRLDGDACVK